MNKQTKMLVGVGLVGVATYLLWKNSQSKATTSFVGDKKKRAMLKRRGRGKGKGVGVGAYGSGYGGGLGTMPKGGYGDGLGTSTVIMPKGGY